MKPLIIFGSGQLAEVVHFFFKHDSQYRSIIAFTVDAAYVQESAFCGLPVVAFEEIERRFPPEQYDMFVAVGYSKLNQIRATKCQEAKDKGYKLATYISSKATVWPGLQVGDNGLILEDNTIQPFVKIGNHVTLWSGNHIGHHAQIGDNCFITSHVVVSGGVNVGANCFIGVNSTIRNHVALARFCIIGANSLIVKDTKEYGVYSAAAAELSSAPSHRIQKI